MRNPMVIGKKMITKIDHCMMVSAMGFTDTCAIAVFNKMIYTTTPTTIHTNPIKRLKLFMILF
jgi:hypothetical protein